VASVWAILSTSLSGVASVTLHFHRAAQQVQLRFRHTAANAAPLQSASAPLRYRSINWSDRPAPNPAHSNNFPVMNRPPDRPNRRQARMPAAASGIVRETTHRLSLLAEAHTFGRTDSEILRQGRRNVLETNFPVPTRRPGLCSSTSKVPFAKSLHASRAWDALRSAHCSRSQLRAKLIARGIHCHIDRSNSDGRPSAPPA